MKVYLTLVEATVVVVLNVVDGNVLVVVLISVADHDVVSCGQQRLILRRQKWGIFFNKRKTKNLSVSVAHTHIFRELQIISEVL